MEKEIFTWVLDLARQLFSWLILCLDSGSGVTSQGRQMQTSDWDKINLAMLNEIHSEDDQPSELVQTQKNNEIEAGTGWKSEDEVREYFNISHHDPYFIRKDSVENNFSCGDKNQSAIIRVHIVKPKSKSQSLHFKW